MFQMPLGCGRADGGALYERRMSNRICLFQSHIGAWGGLVANPARHSTAVGIQA